MKVYLDLVVLLNFAVNYGLLRMTAQLTGARAGPWRLGAGAAVGAVGVMAATQNQRQLRRTTRKVMKGAENAVLQLDRMVGDFVEKHMDS